ncbi:hypothetical protein [Amycolatopsis cihanbeyliensis]|uniref:Small secreted protein n=1 Tax=Amycolatopsis cihanbeyliensis TaxID=1128664 RepID=A0A542DR15_AMYCI|nr:hypothetical protein [Amycolatopsis cihanbeyliensis]TQJ05541.1 hypothetical protein FB471_5378 [Amycolatopsis cihanbeyliensis]
MIPRLVIGAVAACGLALAAGCGSDEPAASGEPAGQQTKTGSAEAGSESTAWADQVCTAIQAQASKMTTLPPLESDQPQDVRQAMLTYLDTLSGAFDDLSTRIEAAGPPPVTDGGALVEQTIGTLEETKQTLDTARAKADGATISDPAAFQSTMTEVGAKIQELQGMDDPTKNLKQNPVLKTAFAEAPACKRLEGE